MLFTVHAVNSSETLATDFLCLRLEGDAVVTVSNPPIRVMGHSVMRNLLCLGKCSLCGGGFKSVPAPEVFLFLFAYSIQSVSLPE